LGDILPFGLLFKGPGKFLVKNMGCFLGILRVLKGFMYILTFKFSFKEYVLAFFLVSQLFWLLYPKIGRIFPQSSGRPV
jgi:hypothetical protein